LLNEGQPFTTADRHHLKTTRAVFQFPGVLDLAAFLLAAFQFHGEVAFFGSWRGSNPLGGTTLGTCGVLARCQRSDQGSEP